LIAADESLYDLRWFNHVRALFDAIEY
jgi:hypothetical protein